MIYKLVSGESPFIRNEGLYAVPDFKDLSDKQMFFVCLVCDPSRDNPLGTLSGRLRRERAAELAGYPAEPDGKRLAKNGRELVYGNVNSVEKAIDTFKRIHYDQHHHNKEALKKQIAEIREFLEGDKRVPLLNKGQVVLDSSGKEIFITDQKALKLAVELGVKLPELEEALSKLESYDQKDTKFEGITYTANDLEDIDDEELSVIDRFHKSNQKE